MKPYSTWYANSQRIRILMMSVISGHVHGRRTNHISRHQKQAFHISHEQILANYGSRKYSLPPSLKEEWRNLSRFAAADDGWTSNTFLTAEDQLESCFAWCFHHSTIFSFDETTTSWAAATYCRSSLSRASMFASLLRNGRSSRLSWSLFRHWVITTGQTLGKLFLPLWRLTRYDKAPH